MLTINRVRIVCRSLPIIAAQDLWIAFPRNAIWDGAERIIVNALDNVACVSGNGILETPPFILLLFGHFLWLHICLASCHVGIYRRVILVQEGDATVWGWWGGGGLLQLLPVFTSQSEADFGFEGKGVWIHG